MLVLLINKHLQEIAERSHLHLLSLLPLHNLFFFSDQKFNLSREQWRMARVLLATFQRRISLRANASVSQGMQDLCPRFSDNHMILPIFLCRNITRAGVQDLLARFEARLVAPATSSVDSTDSCNGDDARHYLYGRDEALGRHCEVSQETEHLEAALAASQTTLAAVEGESRAVWAQLADSDARIFR